MSTGGHQTQPALSTLFTSSMADAPVLKRRRTTAACNSCRAKKSKVRMLPLPSFTYNIPSCQATHLKLTSSVMADGQYVAVAPAMVFIVPGASRHKTRTLPGPSLHPLPLPSRGLNSYLPFTNSWCNLLIHSSPEIPGPKCVTVSLPSKPEWAPSARAT